MAPEVKDSYEVGISVLCLCCNRFYMRKVRGHLGPEREACQACEQEVLKLLRECTRSSLHAICAVNRLKQNP